MEARFVYITCSDQTEAKRIGQVLVEQRMAACVNILPGMTSIYVWENRVTTDEEVVLIAKTTPEALSSLIYQVKEMHSYDVPCIVALPIEEGNFDFFQWIRRQVDS